MKTTPITKIQSCEKLIPDDCTQIICTYFRRFISNMKSEVYHKIFLLIKRTVRNIFSDRSNKDVHLSFNNSVSFLNFREKIE